MMNRSTGPSLISSLLIILTLGITSTVQAAPFNLGDIFAAVGDGSVRHYSASGVLIETLSLGVTQRTTGMAFDASGNLYATGWDANVVKKFDNQGVLLGDFGSGYSKPESIVFDKSGDVYVSNVLNGGIRKFDSAGNFLMTILTGVRVDWMDLAADQTTMLFTQEGNAIKRVNVSTGILLSNFATASSAYALRILSDGGVLLADRANVKRYNASGTVIQNYDVSGEDSWFSLSLNPDGTSFWSGNFSSGKMYKFDVGTGSVLQIITTVPDQQPARALLGIAVFGEPILCGNGNLDPGEECDDGNTRDGDCCSSQCTFEAAGSPCDDANACTANDACQSGICMGSNSVVCTASDQCHVAGTCDPVTGGCSNPPAPDGTACNDGDACTGADYCQNGACTGFNPVVCTPSDQCHVSGTCNPLTGVCSDPAAPDGTGCDDGSVCTTSDACMSGICVGGPPPLEVCNGIDDNCNGITDEGCIGKVTGGGEIEVPGGMANFGFVVLRKSIGDPATGQLEYYNHARGLNVHSLSIQTLTVTGKTATFTGDCVKNQVYCTFSVTLEDNGEPGKNLDRFTLAVSDEPTEGDSAPIARGNVQIHAPPGGSRLSVELTTNQSPNALAGAGAAIFPAGTSFNGVAVTDLQFGLGINMPGNGSADGTQETTLIGTGQSGQSQTITVEVAATSGYVTPSGSVFVSGVSSVDMGDGTPPRTQVPFTLAAFNDSQGQPSMTLALDTTSLPVATIDKGGISPPMCYPPPEIGIDLAFVNTTDLSWSASDASASYNLYRGAIGGGARPFNHVCFERALPGPAGSDATNPSTGQTFYYLVSGRNTCGEGSLGADSYGLPRPNPVPCP